MLSLPIVKPKTRAECANVPRPCPWVSCKYNLSIDVDEKSIIKNDAGPCNCALDVAERDGLTSVEIADITGFTEQQVVKFLRLGLLKIMQSSRSFEGYGKALPTLPRINYAEKKHGKPCVKCQSTLRYPTGHCVACSKTYYVKRNNTTNRKDVRSKESSR